MPRRRWTPGDPLTIELYALLAEHLFSHMGPEAQLQLASLLGEHGFTVSREVKVPGYRRVPAEGKKRGKIGRIDLLAIRGSVRVGIEIDSWRTPKTKSVLKLLAFADLTHRIVLLNHAPGLWGAGVSLPTGVDQLAGGLDLVLHLDVLPLVDSDRVSGSAASWKH
ncbi:MAG: hypothetical protein AB7I35_17555 [Ramlibacter sp.]